LEALRVFEPDIYEHIKNSKSLFTSTDASGSRDGTKEREIRKTELKKSKESQKKSWFDKRYFIPIISASPRSIQQRALHRQFPIWVDE